MSDYFTDPYTRCPYRAGWCEKEADHEGSHYTTYRDGELWTMPAAAPAEGLEEAHHRFAVPDCDWCRRVRASLDAEAALTRHESAGSE